MLKSKPTNYLQSIIAAGLFLVLAMLFNSPWFLNKYVDNKATEFLSNVKNDEAEFQNIYKAFKQKQEQEALEFKDFLHYANMDYTLLLYKDGQLKYWSDRKVIPENFISKLQGENQLILPFLDDYDYLISDTLSQSENLIYLRPLLESPTTKYNSLFHKDAIFSIVNKSDGYISRPIEIQNGTVLAYLVPKAGKHSTIYVEISWILFLFFSILATILFVRSQLRKISWREILLLTSLLFGIKMLIKWDPFGAFTHFSWAQPFLFANQLIGSSFLILLVNFFFLALIMIIWYSVPIKFLWLKNEQTKWIRSFIISLNISFSFWLAAYSIRSLITDSGDIILFEPINSSYSVFVSLLIFLSLLLFTMFTVRWYRYVFLHFDKRLITTTALLVFLNTTILFAFSFPLDENLVHQIWLFLLLIGIYFITQNEQYVINRMSGFAVIIFLASVYAAVAVQNYDTSKLENQLKLVSKQILLRNDDLTEFLLQNKKEEIFKDRSIQKMANNPLVSKSSIFQRLQNEYFDSDFPDYEISYDIQSRTDFISNEPVLIHNLSYEDFDYSLSIPLNTSKAKSVLTIHLVRPKVITQASFYSKLKGFNSSELFTSQMISYAINENNNYRFVKGDIDLEPVDSKNDLPVGRSRMISNKKGYLFTYRNDESEFIKVLVEQSQNSNNLFYKFTTFFTIFFFSYLLVIVFATRFRLRNAQFFNQSLANQIQYIVLSVLFLGGFIIILISNRSVKNEINNFGIQNGLNLVNQVNDDFNRRSQSDAKQEEHLTMPQFLKSVYNDNATDMQYFDSNGQMVYANNDLLYKQRIWLDKINPNILEKFTTSATQNTHIEERVNDHKFIGFYQAIRDADWQLTGILYHPNFDFFQNENREQDVINYTTFQSFSLVLFLLTIASLLLTQTFTRLLNIIRRRLAEVDLNNTIEPLEWNTNDEIGLLVKEYNAMVNKLEESAILLARSERESVWKDVAKQVAHEVKNPLTPMKLSIQHLKRRLKSEDVIRSQTIIKTLDTLENQIEHLSVIASNFSSISKLEVPNFTVVDLVHILKDVARIFSINEQVTFEFIIDENLNSALIKADATMINRVLTNLIKNAEQAIQHKQGRISLTLQEDEGHYLVEVRDNGHGIPRQDRAKIFTPNFTTKSSGSGIGLMMSNKIAEMHRGSLTFESVVDSGTSFYLSLPKYFEE